MQIAAQHAETVCKGSRVSMKERLLLYGVALHATHIAPGNIESSATVIADFANSRLAFRDGTGVTTGVTANAIPVQLLVQLTFADLLIDDVFERRQTTPLVSILNWRANYG